ncbi:CBL-interacting protein kinase 6-like [Canna indica]|uniref:non-specific serine/threonine protein kinase n=1 Tax=Canna indica TaxID=4628 RepID=A0AAQ3KRL0_9LILI|nr:CBL-interacting protein kinase 6-like [Canna indica]
MEDCGRGGVLDGRYDLGRVLGRGAFGKVHYARDLRSGRSVAVKVVDKGAIVRSGMMDHVKREISAMRMVRHPNVVELYEVMATRTKIYLAMELVRGGELFARISRAGRLSESASRRYFRQLVSAVDFCHQQGVYHRDLKLENLLLDGNGDLKVADFGLSALVDDARSDGLLHTMCGTPAYVAPEVFGKRGYDGAKADVWSCGVILFVLLSGSLPFRDDNLMVMYKKICRGEFQCPPWISSGARRVITRMLDPNPNTRITLAKLMEAPWSNKTTAQKSVPAEENREEGFMNVNETKEPVRLNAFHLISFSDGFNLSPLFGGGAWEEGMRFTTRESTSCIVSKLEGLAASTSGKYRVTKSSAAGVCLEGDNGRKGKLAIAAEIFALAPSVHVVEVRKDYGDTLEYQRFCADELRPALKDIMWSSSNYHTITA